MVFQIGNTFGELNKGRVTWSKGLTKETDERLAIASKNMRGTRGANLKLSKVSKKLIKEGIILMPPNTFKKGHILHNKNKTKDNYEPLKRVSEKLKNKNVTEIARENMSKSATIVRKRQWQDLSYRKKIITNSLKGLFTRPTSLEKRYTIFFEQHILPFSYCGNGAMLIGFKNPDFVNCNGEKKCIEVRAKKICEIWGKCLPEEYEKQRIRHFAKWGWKCLVLWDDELENETNVLNKINVFLGDN
jgi:hypothetical protein